jgi:excinuclease ABC subunit C
LDGGKGQLKAAMNAISQNGLNLNMAALAKEFEYIFIPARETPVILPRDSKALKLLQRIRDEAHRFALGYHRKLRGKKLGESQLDGIPGIGDKKKRSLLKHFGSLEKLKGADVSEIVKVKGITRKDAENIRKYFVI